MLMNEGRTEAPEMKFLRQRLLLLASVFRPALRLIQPPIQWVLGVHSQRQSAAVALR
jgi:hypothetical protein